MENLSVGMIVTAKWEPLYWDSWDNDNNPEDYDEDELIPPEEHPGFNSAMDKMLGNQYEIIQISNAMPWVKLRNENGDAYWWHLNWLQMPQYKVELTEADKASKYFKVINKIKCMQARRLNSGYLF